MTKTLIKKYFFIGLVVMFAASSIFYTIETVASGAEVAALEKTNSDLLRQKADLEDTFIKTLSLNHLQEKSAELGFVKPTNIVYVSQVEPVAALR